MNRSAAVIGASLAPLTTIVFAKKKASFKRSLDGNKRVKTKTYYPDRSMEVEVGLPNGWQ